MMQTKTVDIAIIGGGMVGASFALALRSAVEKGLRVAVIEAANVNQLSAEDYQPSFDGRVTALSYGSRLIFEAMGVWSRLCEHTSPIKRIHVSEKKHFGSVVMNSTEAQVDALGYVVENAWLGRALLNELKQCEGIEWITPAEVKNITMKADGGHIVIEEANHTTTLQAQLTVIADGGRSSLCEQLGIYATKHPYEQHAIIAVIETEKPHQQTAYERFTATGPMALLPLDSHKMGVVWTVSDDQAKVSLALSDADFLKAIQTQFGYRLGAFKKVGKRVNYPLNLIKRDEQVRTGLVVLGNAAHTLHPVAGQGFNLALRDVASLAELLLNAFEKGESLSNIALLKRYQEQQQSDQDKTIHFSHLTTTLFSSSRLSSVLVRRVGFMALQLMPFAKNWLMHQAMGLGGARADLASNKRSHP
jgi:2-octaprenyl-6-methoxyphenol hydroxylase